MMLIFVKISNAFCFFEFSFSHGERGPNKKNLQLSMKIYFLQAFFQKRIIFQVLSASFVKYSFTLVAGPKYDLILLT